tara:strand:+ start:945 stop:1499 length:555 start_codon:yes stop_codon:yes gene_type:complete
MRAFCPPKNTPEKDIVMTPEYLAKDIIKHYNPTGLILDPSRGGGAFYDNFDAVYPHTKDWCEIGEGRDFFTYYRKVDWIVTNPPWSKMQKFLEHGMKIADNIVYLTTINHYTTKKRIRDMREYGFGIKEFYCVHTPPNPWPQLGFQLAAVHTQRNWGGGITMSYSDVTIKNVSQEIDTPLTRLL